MDIVFGGLFVFRSFYGKPDAVYISGMERVT